MKAVCSCVRAWRVWPALPNTKFLHGRDVQLRATSSAFYVTRPIAPEARIQVVDVVGHCDAQRRE
jgi:hypothetical protein